MFSQLSFMCDQCDQLVSGEIEVPETNMENNEGTYSEDTFGCPVCGHTYSLEINNRGGVVFVSADGVSLKDDAASTPYVTSVYEASSEEELLNEELNWYFTISKHSVHEYFEHSMESLRSMLSIQIEDRHQSEVFNRMLLVQAVASMEAYLSDTLISRVLTNEELLETLFRTNSDLKKERYPVIKFITNKELPNKIAKEYLSDLIYHNLPKVEALYKSVLRVEFDYGDVNQKKELYEAVQARHDFVHRNGKTREGNVRITDTNYVLYVLAIIEEFIAKLDGKLQDYDDDIPF